MHKCYEEAKCKIDKIVERGINGNNLKALGDLVDIVKDIEYIRYLQAKRASVGDDTEEAFKSMVHDKIGDIMKMYERYCNSGSEEDKAKVHKMAKEVVEAAESIKSALSGVAIDDDISSHTKRVFR